LLFGGYGTGANSSGDLNDLWKFTPSTGEWTWMSGSNSACQPGVYGTLTVPAAGNIPGGRGGSATWTDSSGNFWLFGGEGCNATGTGGDLNDLWKYTPSTGEWTWMNGSNSWDQSSVYGTKGVPAASNGPGARHAAIGWTDASGNLWLFGGWGYYLPVVTIFPEYNSDLWEYTPSIGEWAWMSGGNLADETGVYGAKGVPAAGNVPGARDSAVSWTDSGGNFWLFGGSDGIISPGQSPYLNLNDLWMYGPTPSASTPSLTTPAPDSTLSGSTATFAWSNPGNSATRFVLRLGTTGFGSMDVYHPSPTTAATAQVSGIPANGAYLYARLWYYLNGKWQYTDAIYTEAGTPTPPAFTTLEPGSTLPGSTVTFGWDPGKGPTRFVLRLGTTGFGSSDVYSGPSTTDTPVLLTTIPTNGAMLYARLWYYLNGNWQYVDASYTEASQ
jgi:hypothetical protein